MIASPSPRSSSATSGRRVARGLAPIAALIAASPLLVACSSTSSASAPSSDATADATADTAPASCEPADANALPSGACATGDRCARSTTSTCGPGVKAIPCGGGTDWLCECVGGQWSCSADAGFCLQICDAGADGDADAGD